MKEKREGNNRYKLRAACGVSPKRLVVMCCKTAQNSPSKTTHGGGGIEILNIVMLTIPGAEY